MKEWQIEMADIIADVADNLIRKHGASNRGILVLSGFDAGVGYDVFIGKRAFVEYSLVNESDMENVALLRDLKFTPPLSKRPIGIEIFIKQGSASTKLTYPEDVDKDELVFSDTEPIVSSYFGSMPIKYPSMPRQTWNLPAS